MNNAVNTTWKLIEDLNKKQGITEIIINGTEAVFVERNGQFIQLNVPLTKDDLFDFAQDVAKENNKFFDDQNPILDGTLADGSRINIINEPYAKDCLAISIRKYLPHIKTFDDGDELFGIDDFWKPFFKSIVASRCNVLVSGGTGVGKTTFMNLLLAEVPISERIVTIEDTIELSLSQPNVVRLESFENMPMRTLVKNSLRMRPDRIIIGEVRGPELFDLLQAMNTGHDGSMSSVHASSSVDCFSRIESLFLMSGHDIPIQVVRKQVSQGVDFIIQLGRNREGKRIITDIIEVTGMEGANILSQRLAIREGGKLVTTGITPKKMNKLHEYGGIPMNYFTV